MAIAQRIAVVVPCHRVARHVLAVLAGIGPEVASIYCVDDACPEGSGDLVEREVTDPRVRVLRHAENRGVGAAVITGYWDLFDPTNGYTAPHADVAARLPLESVSRRYFFETDLLFRLNTLRAAVVDVPMDARYGNETSGLALAGALGEFTFKHARSRPAAARANPEPGTPEP